MATHIGNEGTVKIGANTLAEVKSWSLTERAAVADDSAIGDAWDTHLIGSKSWDGEVECGWDETDSNGQGALTVGASVTLNLYPEGADSGDVYHSGTAAVIEIVHQQQRNAQVTARFRFQGNGALTHPTVGS